MIPFFKKNQLIHNHETKSNVDKRILCAEYFSKKFNSTNFLLTKSCTQSLELAFMALGLPDGKEVIMPSYGFVSIANAATMQNLRCVFVDCDPGTMNIDIDATIDAITENTAAIVTINYSGVSCDYDRLTTVCKDKSIYLIEDNAHGINCKYKNQFLGHLGDISTISFDFFKNISCDEGGGISINNTLLWDNFIKAYHFGTNRQEMMEGHVSAYEWKHIGTNSLLAEPLAEILYVQLQQTDKIINQYISNWNFYYQELQALENKGYIQLPKIPEYAQHNGHMFWIKTADELERKRLIDFLKNNNIGSAFHYTPLHSSEFGRKVGEFRGIDRYTTKESERLLRLPQYYLLKRDEQERVVEKTNEFYQFFN